MIVWKDDVDYPDYFKISNDGQVYSKRTNKIIKTRLNKKGYKDFTTRLNGRKGKSLNLRVHRMVAKAFIPNPHNKSMVNHIDGNKTNNHVSNLEWCTNQENTIHAYGNGLIYRPSGIECNNSKLTYEQVEYIKNNYIPKDKVFGCRALARKYKTSHTVILAILNNKSYK